MENKIRNIIYSFPDMFVIPVSIILSIVLYKLFPSEWEHKDTNTIVSVGITLAGFLFTVQSIILTLPVENPFVKKIIKYGYLRDVNHFCRRAEITFILITVPLIFIKANVILDLILMSAFFYGLIYVLWVFYIFSNIMTRYERLQ